VHGIIRRSSVFTTQRLKMEVWKHPNFFTHHGDLADSSNLHRLIDKIQPDEIYNLGAQSHVAVSFEVPEYTGEVDAIGAIRILDAIRDSGVKCKYYQASTSELFGGLPETAPQNESTPFYPKSPYGAAKLYAYWVTVNYRESYNLFACNGILFNHESPRRGETFVTKKISKAVANIFKGKQDKLLLGNLYAKRDWGHAKDYVEAMWMMLQQTSPEDYVIASGETHTVKEFVEKAFEVVDIKIEWMGEGINENGINKENGRILVEINPKYFRPAEVDLLWGNPEKAKKELGWQTKISFEELVEGMVKYDLEFDNYGGSEIY
ncbi:MAG: GDP-mannose 4,6-dehydratase, partial [Bacteroidetes bacterium]|nr:GDP-mannose 4,6-dehydratase [Bacteroidota bacterium]